MSIEAKLKSLGLDLPLPPKPVGSYVPAVRSGSLVFLSGMIPFLEGKVAKEGKLGTDLTVAEGQAAARLALLNGLSALKEEISSLDRVHRIIRICGYIASAPGFHQQPAVLNGASDLLLQVFGEKGWHARLAVGVGELPLNAPVELEIIVEVTPG